MTESEMMERVSYHAVVRYIQRVLGVVESEEGTSHEVCERHCAAADLTLPQVRALILTAPVRLAITSGITRVRGAEFGARLSDGGYVKTITAARRPHKRVRFKSKREVKTDIQKLERRNRRRPACV